LGSIGLRGVLDRAEVLLHGHPDLKSDFNMFLPAQYKLSLTDNVDQEGGTDRPIEID
jgi:histone deacetylase complex regulatory component SIN3